MLYKKQIETAEKLVKELTIPAMPEAVIKLQQLFEQSEFPDPKKIKNLLSMNPYIAGELVSLANMPNLTSGMNTPVKDIDAALFRLGNQYIKNYIMAIMVKQFMETKKIASLSYHSQIIAIYCSLIARNIKTVRPDEAYLLGLLHDIGAFALAELDEIYGQVFVNTLNKHYSLARDEFNKFGTTHSAMGYVIVTSWSIPKSMAQTILLHHSKQLEDIKNKKLQTMVAMVKLAHSLAIKSLNKVNQTKETKLAYDKSIEVLGLSEDDIKHITSEAEKSLPM